VERAEISEAEEAALVGLEEIIGRSFSVELVKVQHLISPDLLGRKGRGVEAVLEERELVLGADEVGGFVESGPEPEQDVSAAIDEEVSGDSLASGQVLGQLAQAQDIVVAEVVEAVFRAMQAVVLKEVGGSLEEGAHRKVS
jgi:hypothetical protein